MNWPGFCPSQKKKLAKWENGVGFPNVKTFELLIRVSGKTLTELLGQEGQDDALYEAIAIYKGEIKMRNRIIVTLVAAGIFIMIFSIGRNGLDRIRFLCLPFLISLIGITFLFTGQQQNEKKSKSLWLFVLGGCFLAYPLVFYVVFLVIVPFCLWRTGSNVRGLSFRRNLEMFKNSSYVGCLKDETKGLMSS